MAPPKACGQRGCAPPCGQSWTFPRPNTLPRNSLSSGNHHPGDPHVPAGPGPGHRRHRTCVPGAGFPAHACCSLNPALLPTRLTWVASGFALGSKIRSCLSWKSREGKTAQLGRGGSLGAGRPAPPQPQALKVLPRSTQGKHQPTRQPLSSPGSSSSSQQGAGPLASPRHP